MIHAITIRRRATSTARHIAFMVASLSDLSARCQRIGLFCVGEISGWLRTRPTIIACPGASCVLLSGTGMKRHWSLVRLLLALQTDHLVVRGLLYQIQRHPIEPTGMAQTLARILQ